MTTASSSDRLAEAMHFLRPVPCPYPLVRIGGSSDGAYLVPDDLSDIAACFSPGVANRKDFEDDLLARYGIPSYMCDFSSEGDKFATPLDPNMQFFTKLWLDVDGTANSITLDEWVAQSVEDTRSDLLLQMDIEGAEYRNLSAVSTETLQRFRVIVLELHGLTGLLNEATLESKFLPLLRRLDENHVVVHAHPNNCCGEFILPSFPANVPVVVELTLLRRDRVDIAQDRRLASPSLPHPLDISRNVATKPPLHLGEWWSHFDRREASWRKIQEDLASWFGEAHESKAPSFVKPNVGLGDASEGRLASFARNDYSQFGEDGIIEEVLRRIGAVAELDRWCVEFGAWDGVHFSNTCRLIRDAGYSAVMIESDPERVTDLNRNHPGENVVKIQRFVELEGANSLDGILTTTTIPQTFDLLSIDIDGCDYWVWQSMSKYQPKVVVIEYNPTIPNSVDFVQPPSFGVKQGASARALASMAGSKGYVLVEATVTNLIFVRGEYADAVAPDRQLRELETLRDDGSFQVFAFSGYDGSIILSRPLKLVWHKLNVPQYALQVVPEWLRKFPGDFSPAEREAWAAYRSQHFGV